MPLIVDARTMLSLVAQICCAGVMLQSLEVLWNWRELAEGRLLGWPSSRTPASNPAVSLVRTSYQSPGSIVILAWRAGAALACAFLPYGTVPVFWLLASLVVAQMYFNRRFSVLFGNCDTIALVCLSAACAGGLPSATPRLQSAALVFVAFHAALAYVMTGYDKLKSPLWRDGTRLVQILQDGNYRLPPLGDCLARHPLFVAACAWSVILLELLFPLCVTLPPSGFWLFITGGLIFHASVAFTMGLHGFWWSFASAYPAFYFVHACVFSFLQQRT